jgi:hypothetical protein
MVVVEGEYLVWQRQVVKSHTYHVLIGLNVSFDHARQIAESKANADYPKGWHWQGERLIFRSDAGPGSPEADIVLTSFNDKGR